MARNLDGRVHARGGAKGNTMGRRPWMTNGNQRHHVESSRCRFVMSGVWDEGRQRELGVEDGMLLVRGHPGGGCPWPSDASSRRGRESRRVLSLIVAEEGSRFEVFRGNKAPTMYGNIWAHVSTYRRQTRGSRATMQGSLGEGPRNQTKQKGDGFDGMDSDSSRLELQMAAVQGLPSQAYIVQLGT